MRRIGRELKMGLFFLGKKELKKENINGKDQGKLGSE